MKKLLYLLLLFLAATTTTTRLSAQSFLKKYNGLSFQRIVAPLFVYPNGNIGMDVQAPYANNSYTRLIADPDGNLLSNTPKSLPEALQHLLLPDGSLISAGGVNEKLDVWKRDAAGNVVWHNQYPMTSAGTVAVFRDTRVNDNGDIFIRGYFITSGVPHYQLFVVKIDAAGIFQWVNTVITNDFEYGVSVEPDPLGGCLVGRSVIDTAVVGLSYQLLSRYEADGATAWSIKAPGQIGETYYTRGYASNAAGQTLVISTSDQNWVFDSTYWMLLGPAGDTLWNFTSTASPLIKYLRPHVVLADGTSAFYVAGNYELNDQNQYIATVARIDTAGNLVWVKSFGPLSSPGAGLAYFHSGTVLTDGSVLLTGTVADDIFLLKIPADGSFFGFQNVVEGVVTYDGNTNCVPDAGDTPLSGWIVKAEGNGFEQYGFTDAVGHYDIPFLDTGYFQVIVTPPSYLWDACQDTVQIYFPYSATSLTETVDFAEQTPAYCPLLEVQLTAPSFRPCLMRSAYATVCNNGTAPAAPYQLTVVLDPLLDIASAQHPYTVQGDTVTFSLDTLQPFQCETYSFQVNVSCNAQLGQTLCMTAHVSPDSLCLFPPDWSGANIVVNGECEGDSVHFRIKNTGGAPMNQSLDFVIIDDHVITRMGEFNLAPEEVHTETVPADGSTWRLTAEQEPGHPFGYQKPSVAVEGCSVNTWFSTDMLNLFASYSGDPFDDVECQPVVASYDPNDKTGMPLGLDYDHCVEATEVLDYVVRFQNTGTAPAFYVEIQDTLSNWLDPASIQAVSASHDFRWTLSGNGILKFFFDDIVLPDSNASQDASQGFVRFRIAQRAGNPLGAQIFNRAGIYFDQNAAVLTNTTFHTVCQDFIEVQVSDVQTPGRMDSGMTIYPNPAGDAVFVQFSPDRFAGGRLRLLDLYGRVLRQQTLLAPSGRIERNGLTTGMYFVEYEGNNGERVVRPVMFE